MNWSLENAAKIGKSLNCLKSPKETRIRSVELKHLLNDLETTDLEELDNRKLRYIRLTVRALKRVGNTTQALKREWNTNRPFKVLGLGKEKRTEQVLLPEDKKRADEALSIINEHLES